MSVSLRKQRDKPSENRIFKKENKYGNLSIIHHSQRLPKGTFRTAWGGGKRRIFCIHYRFPSTVLIEETAPNRNTIQAQPSRERRPVISSPNLPASERISSTSES